MQAINNGCESVYNDKKAEPLRRTLNIVYHKRKYLSESMQRFIALCRETGELPVLTEETELTAAPPFDELYRHYVEAQVHYANGETARYNSAAGLWNNAFLTYRDYRARTAVPEGGAPALRLC